MSVNHHDRLAEQVERDEVPRHGYLVDACQRQPALAKYLVGFARVHVFIEVGGGGQRAGFFKGLADAANFFGCEARQCLCHFIPPRKK